jgi:hypothetical protein
MSVNAETSIPRIQVFTSNGKRLWGDVVRLNNSTVWVRLLHDGNLIKRSWSRLPKESVEQLESWRDDYAVRLASRA